MHKRSLHGVILASALAAMSLPFLGASCDGKKKVETPAVGAGTEAQAKGTAPPAPSNELPGVDLSSLGSEQKARLLKLVDKLQSPCGKAHALKTSLATDPECKRSLLAARHLARRAAQDLSEEELEVVYEARYLRKGGYQFDLKSTPFDGAPNSPVVLVEFFDYGCPACKQFSMKLEDLVAELPSEVVVYYKNFPLSSHPDSIPAAMAAVSAAKQGKFREMHRKLFSFQTKHSKEDLFRYAKEIGLDQAKFEADMQDPATRAKVMADREEGLKADLEGTPTLYVSGRKVSEYDMAGTLSDLVDVVREELALHR
ncbi:MAG: thioredoxin domain-containing protein [Deltaproteobacteria bacterium]|nr:thioredoxin domain-containing protein [Deltaproteobacteria bacterium]